jgi:zinc ribbon protein
MAGGCTRRALSLRLERVQCHVCGTEVRPEHKFCMECGARLRSPGSALALAPPTPEDDETSRLPALPAPANHPMFDPVTGQLLAVPPPPPLPPPDDDATEVLPAVGAPLGRGGFGPPDVSAQGPGRWDHPPDPAPAWPIEPYPASVPATTVQPSYRDDYGSVGYEPTGPAPPVYAPWDVPAWEQAEPAKQPRAFRLKPLLLLTVLASVAAAVGMFVQVLDIQGTGIATVDGTWKLNDFGTNLTVAGVLTALTMVLGAIAWCAGFRWGAGLAGGGGAGLAGWVALALGQAEVVVARAESVQSGAVEVTRDIGYFGLAGAGALGLITLFVSLLRTGDDGRAGLDPWVAALGAMATIAAVVGPLIPVDNADVELNWSSAPGTDVPTAWFAARFAQLVLLLLCGVFGFLVVRRYGLGLAIGGTICAGWLVLTTATEQTDSPIGLAVGNPDYSDLEPHIVTIVGVGLMLFFGLVATAMALIDDR